MSQMEPVKCPLLKPQDSNSIELPSNNRVNPV